MLAWRHSVVPRNLTFSPSKIEISHSWQLSYKLILPLKCCESKFGLASIWIEAGEKKEICMLLIGALARSRLDYLSSGAQNFPEQNLQSRSHLDWLFPPSPLILARLIFPPKLSLSRPCARAISSLPSLHGPLDFFPSGFAFSSRNFDSFVEAFKSRNKARFTRFCLSPRLPEPSKVRSSVSLFVFRLFSPLVRPSTPLTIPWRGKNNFS